MEPQAHGLEPRTGGVQQVDSLYAHTELSIKSSPNCPPAGDCAEIPDKFCMTDATDILKSTEAPEVKLRQLEKAYLELMVMNEQLVEYLKKSKHTIQKLKKVNKIVESVCTTDGHNKKESKSIDSILRLLSDTWIERHTGQEVCELQDLVVLLDATLAENRTFKSSAKALTDEIGAKNETIENLQNQVKELKDIVVSLHTTSSNATKETAELKVQLESVQKLYSTSTEQLKLQEEHTQAIVRQYNESIKALDEQLNARVVEVTALTEERDSLLVQNRDLTEAHSALELKMDNAKNNVRLLLAQHDEEVELLKAELDCQKQVPDDYEAMYSNYNRRGEQIEALHDKVAELEQTLLTTVSSYDARLKESFDALAESSKALEGAKLEITCIRQELNTAVARVSTLTEKLQAAEAQATEAKTELKTEVANHKQILTVLEEQLKESGAEIQILKNSKAAVDSELAAMREAMQHKQNELSKNMADNSVLIQKLNQANEKVTLVEKLRDTDHENYQKRIATLESQLKSIISTNNTAESTNSTATRDCVKESRSLFTAETGFKGAGSAERDAEDLQHESKQRLIEIVARLTLELAGARGICGSSHPDYAKVDPALAAVIAGLTMQLDTMERSIVAHKENIEALMVEVVKLRGEQTDAGESQVEAATACCKTVKKGMCGQMVVKKSRLLKSRASSRRSSISVEHSDAEFSASDNGDGDIVNRVRSFLDVRDAKDFEIQRLKDKLTVYEEQVNVAQISILAKDNEISVLVAKQASLTEEFEIVSTNYNRLVEQHEKTVLNNNHKMEQQAKDNAMLIQELDLLKQELSNIMQHAAGTSASITIDSPFGTGLPPRQLSVSPGHVTKLQLQRSHADDASIDETVQYSLGIEDGTKSQMEEDDLPLPKFPVPVPGSKPYVDAPRRVLKIEQTGANKMVYEDVELSDSDEYELVNIYSDLTVIEEELMGMVTLVGSTICETEQSIDQSINMTKDPSICADESIIKKLSTSRAGPEEELVSNPDLNKAFQDIKLLKKNITRYALAREKHIRKLCKKLEQASGAASSTSDEQQLEGRKDAIESAKLRLQIAMRPDQTTDISFLQATILRLEEEKTVLTENYNNMECIAKELMQAQTTQEKLIDSLTGEVLTLRQRVKEQSEAIFIKTETIESLTECISRHGEQLQQTSAEVAKERDELLEHMRQELNAKNDEIRCMQETIANMESSRKVPAAGVQADKCAPDAQSIPKKPGNVYYVPRASLEKIIREKSETMDALAKHMIDLQSRVTATFTHDKLTVEGLIREKNTLQAAFDSIITDLRREQESFMDINELDGDGDTGIFSLIDSYYSPVKSSKLCNSPFHASGDTVSEIRKLDGSNMQTEKSLQTSACVNATSDIDKVQRSTSPIRSATGSDEVHPDPGTMGTVQRNAGDAGDVEMHKLSKELSMAKADLELALTEHESEVRRLKTKIQSIQAELLESEEAHEKEISKLRGIITKLREERAAVFEENMAHSLETRPEKSSDYDKVMARLATAEAELESARTKIRELSQEEGIMTLSRSVLATSTVMHEKGIDNLRDQYEQEVFALRRHVQKLTTSLSEQKKALEEEIANRDTIIKDLEKELEKGMQEIAEARSTSSTILAEATAAQLAETTAIISAMEKESRMLADLNTKLNEERQSLINQLAERDNLLSKLQKQVNSPGKHPSASDETSIVALRLQLKSAQDKNRVADRRILDQSSVIAQLRADNERLRRATASAEKGDKAENERLKAELFRVQTMLERIVKGMNEEAQNLLTELAMLRAEHTTMKREAANEIDRLKRELANANSSANARAAEAGASTSKKQHDTGGLPDLDMAAKRAMFELSEATNDYALSGRARDDIGMSNLSFNSDVMTNKFDKVILEITHAIEMRNTLIESFKCNCDKIS